MRPFQTSALCCILASAMPSLASPQAAPMPQPLPAPLLVTVTFAEASVGDINQAVSAAGTEADAPAQILALLRKRDTTVTAFPIMTYMASVEASSQCTQSVPFETSTNGKPQVNFLSVVSGASVVPHQEADGYLLLDIGTTSCQVNPATSVGGPPSTTSRSVHTKLHFRNGQTKMLAGSVLAVPGAKPSSHETLVFVTVGSPTSSSGSTL